MFTYSKVEQSDCKSHHRREQVIKTALGKQKNALKIPCTFSFVTSYTTILLVERNGWIRCREMSSLCKWITFPRTMLSAVPHLKYTSSACAAMQSFKICIKTDWKGFFLRTRDLHLRRPVCSNTTICLTSGGIVGGTEGHACSLKKQTVETLGGKNLLLVLEEAN